MLTAARSWIWALLALVLATTGWTQDTEASSQKSPQLSAADLAAWRDYIRPTQDELAHDALPWLPDFASGLEAAAAERKPLLLWTMNGHPLGCT